MQHGITAMTQLVKSTLYKCFPDLY